MKIASVLCMAMLTSAWASTATSSPASQPATRPSEVVITADVFPIPNVTGRVLAWTAITATHDNQIIAGLCRDKEPAYLAHFDDKTRSFAAVLCVDAIIHDAGQWLAKQAKIHTQLVELSDGWVYGGTHLAEEAKAKVYAGGHWFRYHPASHKMEDLGLAMAQEGLISLVADEPRGCLYAITYPGAYLLRFDLVSRQTQVLGKTSRDDKVNRVFFVLGQGAVYTNQVYSPASQPGGIYTFDADTESQRIEPLPVYRKTEGQYTDPIVKEAPWLYNYWIAGATNSARNVAYTTGYASGHFLSMHLDTQQELTIHDHGLMMPDDPAGSDGELSCHAMCMVGDKVLFAAEPLNPKQVPGREANVWLLQYDPALDTTQRLGVIRTRQGQHVTSCTAMTSTSSGRLYLLGMVANDNSVVLLSIDECRPEPSTADHR